MSGEGNELFNMKESRWKDTTTINKMDHNQMSREKTIKKI